MIENPLGIPLDHYSVDGIRIATLASTAIRNLGLEDYYDTSTRKIVIRNSFSVDPQQLTNLLSAINNDQYYPELDEDREPRTFNLCVSIKQKPISAAIRNLYQSMVSDLRMRIFSEMAGAGSGEISSEIKEICNAGKYVSFLDPMNIIHKATDFSPLLDPLLDHGTEEQVEEVLNKGSLFPEDLYCTLWHRFPQLALKFIDQKSVAAACPHGVIEDLCKARDVRAFKLLEFSNRPDVFVDLCQRFMPFVVETLDHTPAIATELAKSCPAFALDLLFEVPTAEPLIVQLVRAGCLTTARHQKLAAAKKFDKVTEVLAIQGSL